MLKLMVPCFSLLLLYSSSTPWIHTCISLFSMAYLSTMFMIFKSSYMNISSLFAIDLMSASLLVLTMWIIALMFIASYKMKIIKMMTKSFFITVMSLMLILLMSFSVSNLIVFYIWFEASLIPTMVLIMVWGYQPERIQASMYLILYTVTASLPLLLMLAKIFNYNMTLVMSIPTTLNLPMDISLYLAWFILLFAFMVKLPLFGVHLWLPKAHVEAPVAGSMILAAILLKLGGYGLLRMSWLFPYTFLFSSMFMSVALIGAIITSLICLRQTDLKSLIAYSSVGHMGIMLAGIMSGTKLGLYGGLAMMVAHALSSSALFCMANISYEMTHTRSMMLTKGMLSLFPVMSFMWFMFACANMAAPPSINLLSEIILIISTSFYSMKMVILFMLTSFLTCAYSLFLYANINHGMNPKTMNPGVPMKLIYMNLLFTHMWPILFMIIIPSSFMIWC